MYLWLIFGINKIELLPSSTFLNEEDYKTNKISNKVQITVENSLNNINREREKEKKFFVLELLFSTIVEICKYIMSKIIKPNMEDNW